MGLGEHDGPAGAARPIDATSNISRHGKLRKAMRCALSNVASLYAKLKEAVDWASRQLVFLPGPWAC